MQVVASAGGVLQVGLPVIQEGDTWVPAAPLHIQRCIGCGSESLGLGYVRGSGLLGWARTGGQTPKFSLLRE